MDIRGVKQISEQLWSIILKKSHFIQKNQKLFQLPVIKKNIEYLYSKFINIIAKLTLFVKKSSFCTLHYRKI